MSSDLNILLEMGFPENRSKRALAATQYKGLQEAIDWMVAHENDPSIDEPLQEPKGHKLSDGISADAGDGSAAEKSSEGPSAGTSNDQPGQAKSLKCDDCGKLIKTPTDAEVHAARTGHQNYSESVEEVKPLTEEEKKQQMERLQEKIKQRQHEKEEQAKKEAIEKEKLRRKQGKEMTNIKQQMEAEELKKLAEYKRREKMEDKLARQKVREQIARDRAERAARYGKTAEKGDSTSSSSADRPAASQPAPAAKKEYNQARIQIRQTDGTAITHTFSADEQLSAVRLYVQMNCNVSDNFTFMTTYPRKVFTSEDMDTPLKELGLIPSAVLLMKTL